MNFEGTILNNCFASITYCYSSIKEILNGSEKLYVLLYLVHLIVAIGYNGMVELLIQYSIPLFSMFFSNYHAAIIIVSLFISYILFTYYFQ